MYQGKFEAKNRPASRGSVPEIQEEQRQAYKPHQSAANAARQQIPQARPQQGRTQMPPQQGTRPTQGAPRPQQRPAAPVAEPKKKGPRIGGVIFYTLYFLFIAIFCLGTFLGLNYLEGWLEDYEAAQPTAKSEEVFHQLFDNPDWANLYSLAGIQDSAYEGKDAFAAYMNEKVAGAPLTYVETSNGLSEDKKYYVKLNDERIASFTLTNKAEKKTDIPDWELGTVSLSFDRANGYLIQKVDGHTAYVNGVALDDSFTIQTTSTTASEYLPITATGDKIDVQSITGLMMKPTVTIKDQNGTDMPVVYDEETGMYVEQTESNTITEDEKSVVIGALEAYSEYMINASGARAAVAKYFDSSSDAYTDIVNMGKELWMNSDRGHRFLNENVTEYIKYSDDLFYARGQVTLNVALKDGSTKDYDVDMALFFRQKNGKWLCYGMTNENVTKPVGKVRITFINDGVTLSSEFYQTDAASIDTPVVTAPEGKTFTGWVREDTVNGQTQLTVVFSPDENGHVSIPSGTTLTPMTLYALFEDAQ